MHREIGLAFPGESEQPQYGATQLLNQDTYVTEHEETRLKTQFPVVYNAHIKVKSVFYFVLKSIWLIKRQKRTKKNLQDNAVFVC